MKSFRHWTYRYVVNRSAEIVYHWRFPDQPWLTKTANTILSHFLRNSDCGLEWGSGRSTIWFAQRVLRLTSVEHDSVWYGRISKQLREGKINNVVYLLRDYEKTKDDSIKGLESSYVQVVNMFLKDSLDFALVDGVYRSACAVAVLDKIRPGGILVVDNANWFLPSKTASPSSRSIDLGPASSEWGYFLAMVKDWRVIWTSSGVTDTTIWFKPYQG